MKKTFTLNDLFLYHYNEMSSIEREAIEHQLTFDDELRTESAKIIKMKRLLDLEKSKPSSTSIHYIMGYNRQSSGELEAC